MIRRLAALALLALLITSLLAACSGCGPRGNASRAPRTAEDSLADWRGRADSLERTERASDSLGQARGHLAQAGGSAAWTAWFDSDAVRVVHETVDLGPRGRASNRYYFERGVPRLTVEAGLVPADTASRLVPLERTILFDDLGRLVAATMKLDDVKTWVSGDEATAVLDRARRLRASAEEARAGRGSGAPAGDGKPAQR